MTSNMNYETFSGLYCSLIELALLLRHCNFSRRWGIRYQSYHWM